jgi:CheY-like chemotaxis protein
LCSEGGDRPSILLVEDTPVNQKVALKMLKHLGFQPDLATNGLEALHALKKRLYDIVLMDIHMPQMDASRPRELSAKICLMQISRISSPLQPTPRVLIERCA